MSPSLEDQERHLLVKVIDRVLYKLDDLVRPYVHKILVVIEPLLIDEDYYARVEGREIISNLSKAAGLATMIATMRPDIDHVDEYVRNTTARAFSVVASALGIHALLPFLKAVCRSKKSWQARHTGTKIVQQIAILLGCAILPHLRNLVEAIGRGLEDEQQKVKTIAALAIAALAESASPYGIESFDSVIQPLWDGVKKHRGKGRAAFLKAIGYIIPLMDERYANEYTKGIVPTLISEFSSPDEEMKKIVLKVVKQCVGTDGVDPAYIKTEILPDFFRNFWVRRMALDRRNYKQLVETTVEIAQKVGVTEIVGHIVEGLKDESEAYRKMVMETIENVVQTLGTADIDDRLEEVLIDGILYSFQEQTVEDVVMLNGFGTVVNSLGLRVKPYLPQICSTVLWRLNNKSAKVRQQAADLISRIAIVMRTCGEEKLMGQLGVVLYEYLGEEYPEVLGSILKALKSIVNVIGMSSMTPPIKDLLPRLTPILKNRHEKVQENCIDLVGRIADRGAEFVSAREWMRICFELLDMLKAHKKGIRRATVNTFGYIAKAIGPQDVLATLLNNLKVQERQNRVCTTVAIAIVAETCAPFTVLPALMNEYRLPELNVQNGVLKSMSFLFEYIGEMGKDYIYAVTPLLEDALIDRDLVHRQTACATVKHISLGVTGLGCEDALVHLLNLVWPNIFETSPHVINAVMDAIDGLRVALGPAIILNYTLQGMFHPARRVREIYWKIYNSLYIGSQDALIPIYPRIDDDRRNKYERRELEPVMDDRASSSQSGTTATDMWSGRLLMRVSEALSGDRIQLPPDVLDVLLSRSQSHTLPSPMAFEIRLEAAAPPSSSDPSATVSTLPDQPSQPTSSSTPVVVTHGCVREFTADEGVVVVSPFLARQVLHPGASTSTTTAADVYPSTTYLSLRLVVLPKCKFARLAPLNAAYLQIADIRSVLEGYLRRHHSTLTEGEILTVAQLAPPRSFDFLLVELQPFNACVCIDTDMEVDIQPLSQDIAEEAVRLKHLVGGHSSKDSSMIDIQERSSDQGFVPIEGIVGTLNQPIYFRVSRPRAVSKLYLTVTPTQGDVDCFVSFATEKPSMLDHDFFNVDIGQSCVVIDTAMASVDDPFIYISVVPCHEQALFSLALTMQDIIGDSVRHPNQDSTQIPVGILGDSGDTTANMVVCTNCGASVPNRTIQMHIAYCERNNRQCTKCASVLRKEEFSSHWHCDICTQMGHVSIRDKHMSRFHEAMVCECGVSLHLPLIAHHRREECSYRLIMCRFCHLRVRSGGVSKTARDLYLGTNLSEHESECGARTISCQKCGRSVQLKNVQTHAQFHEFEKSSQRIPDLCSNVNCGNSVNEASTNVMRSCQTCFSPFWSSRHDPGNQKLAQRLMARYHLQLTQGCSKPACFNQYCVTSLNDKSPKSPMDATDAAVLGIQLLQSSFIKRPRSPMHYLCVSDAVLSKRRTTAEVDLCPLGFSSAWGVKALLENNDDVERASSWLIANAPRIKP
ncbi:hypothetical protein BASA60_001139 [Batrachochytrium salamandrivorans]|nr:hypothetical protein BASA60_001139 [Batrachochytrium salamandrivorans]